MQNIIAQLREISSAAARAADILEAAPPVRRPLNGRVISAASRRKMAIAQRQRWARVRRAFGPSRKLRVITPAGRRRIAEAQKARWAKFRAAKKGPHSVAA